MVPTIIILIVNAASLSAIDRDPMAQDIDTAALNLPPYYPTHSSMIQRYDHNQNRNQSMQASAFGIPSHGQDTMSIMDVGRSFSSDRRDVVSGAFGGEEDDLSGARIEKDDEQLVVGEKLC